MDIRTEYEGYIDSLMINAEPMTEEEWMEQIRTDSEDIQSQRPDAKVPTEEEIRGIVKVLAEEGLVADIRFDLVESSIEILYKHRDEILQGCTGGDEDPKIIKSFISKEDAYKELETYGTSVKKLSGGQGSYFLVTEYSITEHHYNKNGEMLAFEEVWKYSEMPEIE